MALGTTGVLMCSDVFCRRSLSGCDAGSVVVCHFSAQLTMRGKGGGYLRVWAGCVGQVAAVFSGHL